VCGHLGGNEAGPDIQHRYAYRMEPVPQALEEAEGFLRDLASTP